jgi:hypothetical protein
MSAGSVAAVGAASVEAVVRAQLAKALGGRRGMVEAALPTITFTLIYVSTKELRLAIGLSVAVAVALLVLRLVQRSTVQYVANALVGIAVGCLFVWFGRRNGADPSQAALAYFAPGILYNAGYAVAMVLSIVVRWPLVGLLVGSVSEDPTAWRRDPQVVRLCSVLTAVLVLPCDPFVTALGITKVAMGWPLQVAALGAMLWLLARDRTPVAAPRLPGVSGAG